MSMEATKGLLENVIQNLESEVEHCQDKLEHNRKSSEEITAIMAEHQMELASHREALRILKEK